MSLLNQPTIQTSDLQELETLARRSGAYEVKLIDCRFRTMIYYLDLATDGPERFALYNELELEFPDRDATLLIAVFRKKADSNGDPAPTE